MPDKEQVRKERIETIKTYFESKGNLPTLIDPILFKARTLYPMLKEGTLREYALIVMKIFDVKRMEANKDGEVQSNP